MNSKDFKKLDYQKLDSILYELCELILKNQKDNSEYFGTVGACILSPDGNKVSSTSVSPGDDWIHAEKAAILKYKHEFGDIPKDSICITTLSPCSKPMIDRYGNSCTDLIDNEDIHNVYCGYSDPTQDDSENYKNKKFNIIMTDNKKIQELCKKFADTFLNKE